MASQRKNRNLVERERVRDEIMKSLPRDILFSSLVKDLDAFVASNSSQKFDGEIDACGFHVEYSFPGRRIVKPDLKISRIEQPPPPPPLEPRKFSGIL